MPENTQHYHRCLTPDCSATWTCSRLNCGADELCDACEQRAASRSTGAEEEDTRETTRFEDSATYRQGLD